MKKLYTVGGIVQDYYEVMERSVILFTEGVSQHALDRGYMLRMSALGGVCLGCLTPGGGVFPGGPWDQRQTTTGTRGRHLP